MNFECFPIPRTLKVKLTMNDVWFFCLANEGRNWVSNMYRHFPISGEFEGWLRLAEPSNSTHAIYTGTIDVAGARVGIQVFRAPATDKIYSTGPNANMRFTARSFLNANTNIRETFTEYGDAILTIQPSTLSTAPRSRLFFIPPSDIVIDREFTLKAGEEFEVVDLGYPAYGTRPYGTFAGFVDAPYALRKFDTDLQEHTERTVWFVRSSRTTDPHYWYTGIQILDKMADDYGHIPKRWTRFTVYVSSGRGGGYCSYIGDKVGRVVVRSQFPSCRGATLDHELQHAYLFYLLQQVPYISVNEGLSELVSEKKRDPQRLAMFERARSGRIVPLARILQLYSYPVDSLSVYTEGYSVGEFLILHRNLEHYIAFLFAVHESNDYDGPLKTFYDYENLRAFETAWKAWVYNDQHYGEVKRLRAATGTRSYRSE